MRVSTLLFLWFAGVFLLPDVCLSQEVTERPKEKSAILGVGLALANIAAPLALASAVGGNEDDLELWVLGSYAWIVGPFPGLAYAGEKGLGFKSMGIRTVTWAAALAGTTESIGENGWEAWTLAVVAAGVTVFSWLRDTAAIPGAVKRANHPVVFGPTFRHGGGVGFRVQYRW